MAGIYALSSVSQPPDLPSIVGDKVAHAVLYFGLGGLFAGAIAGGWRRPLTLRAAAVAAIGSTLYGVSDEWHQLFVPPRAVEAADVLADALGSTTAAVLMLATNGVRSRPFISNCSL